MEQEIVPVEQEQEEEQKPNKLLQLLKSRKFWAALVGLAMVIVKGYVPDFPISEDQVLALVMVLVAYILGTGLEDGLSAALRK